MATSKSRSASTPCCIQLFVLQIQNAVLWMCPMLESSLELQLLTIDFVWAGISFTSPRKLVIFVVKFNMYRSKVSQTRFFLFFFWNRNYCCWLIWFRVPCIPTSQRFWLRHTDVAALFNHSPGYACMLVSFYITALSTWTLVTSRTTGEFRAFIYALVYLAFCSVFWAASMLLWIISRVVYAYRGWLPYTRLFGPKCCLETVNNVSERGKTPCRGSWTMPSSITPICSQRKRTGLGTSSCPRSHPKRMQKTESRRTQWYTNVTSFPTRKHSIASSTMKRTHFWI